MNPSIAKVRTEDDNTWQNRYWDPHSPKNAQRLLYAHEVAGNQ